MLDEEFEDTNGEIRICIAKNNKNPYTEEEQTTQWPKDKVLKGQTKINKTYI